MLNYFGEKADSFCGRCGNCIKKLEAESIQERIDRYPEYDYSVADTRKKQLVAAGSGIRKAAENPELYERLRGLRNSLAKELHVPAYCVFTDKTLKEMSMYLPTSKDAMLAILGVGQTKYDKFGKAFTEEIAQYKNSHDADSGKLQAKAKIVFTK